MIKIPPYTANYAKPIDKSEEYWKKRASEEYKNNRGAPEDPYRINYSKVVLLNKKEEQFTKELLHTYNLLKDLKANSNLQNNFEIKSIAELPKNSSRFRKKFSLRITSNKQNFDFILYLLNRTPDEDYPLGISATEKDDAMILLTDSFSNLKELLLARLRRHLDDSSESRPTE